MCSTFSWFWLNQEPQFIVGITGTSTVFVFWWLKYNVSDAQHDFDLSGACMYYYLSSLWEKRS